MAADQGFQLPVTYVGFDETPVTFANTFLVQHQEGEFTITFAQLTPPPVVPARGPIEDQLKEIAFVPAHVTTRIAMPRRRFVELITAMTENLRLHDETYGGQSQGEQGA
jgi:hypothetical protein